MDLHGVSSWSGLCGNTEMLHITEATRFFRKELFPGSIKRNPVFLQFFWSKHFLHVFLLSSKFKSPSRFWQDALSLEPSELTQSKNSQDLWHSHRCFSAVLCLQSFGGGTDRLSEQTPEHHCRSWDQHDWAEALRKLQGCSIPKTLPFFGGSFGAGRGSGSGSGEGFFTAGFGMEASGSGLGTSAFGLAGSGLVFAASSGAWSDIKIGLDHRKICFQSWSWTHQQPWKQTQHTTKHKRKYLWLASSAPPALLQVLL